MTRTMYDSTQVGDAPDGAQLYADYLDIPASHDPRAIVHICRDGNLNAGHVLDVGEGVPNSQAPGWCNLRRSAGAVPSVYTNYANWSAVRAEFARQNVVEPWWWIAWYTTDSNIIARVFSEGAIAVQHANPPISGGHYDISAVANYWPGVDGGNPVAQITDACAFVVTAKGDGYYVVQRDGGLWPFGNAPATWGNMVGKLAGRSIVGFALHYDASMNIDGYWFCQDDGGIFPFGAAPGLGAVPG